MTVRRTIRLFLAAENAQDVVEYTLLLAALALASAAIYLSMSQTINQIWLWISSKLAA